MGVPPKSAKENSAKKQVFFGPKTLFFAFLDHYMAGLFGPFLTSFNEKNIIFSPFRKKFPGKA